MATKLAPEYESLSPNARGNRLKLLRKLTQLSRKDFAEKHGLRKGSLQNWEDGRYGGMNERSAQQLLDALQAEGIRCDLSWLLYGIGENPVPFSNAQQLAQLSEQDKIAQELKLFYGLHKNAVDAIMPDDAMLPVFQAQDHLAGIKYFGEQIKNLIDSDCIIQLSTGEIKIRTLQQAKSPDTYLLVSRNPNGSPKSQKVTSDQVFSAAPILWLRRKNTTKC